jgi:HNH endonuclease
LSNKILLLDNGLVVTEEGEVFLPDGSIKHQYIGPSGYWNVKYKNKRYVVHRLIATSFISNPENKSDVNHKDGNKDNNHVDNLEWMTRTENLYHSLRNGLHDNPEVAVIGTSLLTGLETLYCSVAEAARQTLALQPNISHCLAGKRHTAGQMKWKYANE